MFSRFPSFRSILGLPSSPPPGDVAPEIGDVFYRQPEHGPVEYAEVIGVYMEAAEIRHVRFRLVYGYKDKSAELGERTLAAELFYRRFDRRFATKHAAE